MSGRHRPYAQRMFGPRWSVLSVASTTCAGFWQQARCVILGQHGMVRACSPQSFSGGIVKRSGRILLLEDFTGLWDRRESSGGARARKLMYTME